MPTATENFLGELQKISLVLKRERCQIVIQFMLESKTLIDILSSAPLYKSLIIYNIEVAHNKFLPIMAW